MARERMVTRTVELTVCKVMCLDVTTAEVQINTYELSGTYPDNDSTLKAVKKLHEMETFKCVAVQETEAKEVLYGMTEIDFIKLAKALPPRGTKTVEETNEQ